ncbi:hypothetical protein TWF694_000612 [Orbilia ellipsospora]|uniref:Uncharacterized protein n=1 Tax=Orbilia ellipsospora TaxID=2528407 RepID=A0AAV9XQW1_9PEZI
MANARKRGTAGRAISTSPAARTRQKRSSETQLRTGARLCCPRTTAIRLGRQPTKHNGQIAHGQAKPEHSPSAPYPPPSPPRECVRARVGVKSPPPKQLHHSPLAANCIYISKKIFLPF